MVDVTVNTLDRTFSGRVTRSEGKLALNTRTMNTEIDVPNRNYALAPGMYAQVNVHPTQSRDVLATPLPARNFVGQLVGNICRENVLKEGKHVQHKESRFRGCGRSPEGD